MLPWQRHKPCRHEPRARDSRHNSKFSRHRTKRRLGPVSFTTAITDKQICGFYPFNKPSSIRNAKDSVPGQSIDNSSTENKLLANDFSERDDENSSMASLVTNEFQMLENKQ